MGCTSDLWGLTEPFYRECCILEPRNCQAWFLKCLLQEPFERANMFFIPKHEPIDLTNISVKPRGPFAAIISADEDEAVKSMKRNTSFIDPISDDEAEVITSESGAGTLTWRASGQRREPEGLSL